MASAKPRNNGHLLMFAYSFYGHQKPMCDLAVKIVRSRPVDVTILVGDGLFDKIQAQLEKQINMKTEKHLRSYIRLVGIDGGRSGFDTDSTNHAFASTYKLLASGEPVRSRPNSENMYDALPAPTVAVVDLLSYEVLRCIRGISGDRVCVYSFQTSMAAQVFLLAAPKRLGGRGDFAADLDREATAVDLDKDGIIKFAQQLWERTDGKLISGAGLSEMYDYEAYPQLSVFGDNVSIAYIARYMHRLFSECDGVILNTSYSIEPQGIAAWKHWLGERPVFSLGPLSPPAVSDVELPSEDLLHASTDVENFLDDALLNYGENSVVYMSFGTVFWTTEPEKIWAVFDGLIELQTPFVFAHASPVAVIPDEVRQKVSASGLGYISKWVPQHKVLHHRATGWFLSHCGQNSMLEALMEGVPMICWPYRGDQPCNAINLSMNLNVAYELFEVRNGEHGLAPIRRLADRVPTGTVDAVRHEVRQVLLQAKGEDGKVKRANAERIKVEMAKSWETGGSCRVELDKFLDELSK